jgi:hypothetical protein
VRLLPSYYKPEFISPEFGFNRTFDSYEDVANELVKSCSTDLAFQNLANQDEDEDLNQYQLQYLPNDIAITYNDGINKFQMEGNNVNTDMAYKIWNSSRTYAENEVVSFGINTYISLQNGNINNTPATNPLFWRQVYVDIVQGWDATTAYREGQYVSYEDRLYIAIQNTIDQPNPTLNPDDWEEIITTEPNYYKYLITGYYDPNVQQVQGTGRVQWNPYTVFEATESVEYEGQFWVATKQNKGFVPFEVSTLPDAWNNTTFYEEGDLVFLGTSYRASRNNTNTPPSTFSDTWTIIQWQPSSALVTPIVGLNAISAEFDMMDEFEGIVQYPFPNGILGQPFNIRPRRLLNSILGFTWSGVFNPENLIDVDGVQTTPITKNNAQTELFNRVRPIPQYYKRYTTTGLGSTLTDTRKSPFFTAEGYCNLVYSSIISIYATTIAGTTLNTTTNTGLLAMASINAGNLGVSFFQEGMTAPLSLYGTDIYSLSFRLEDEFGEPYFFTNNAVLSFVLKIDYKKILPDR